MSENSNAALSDEQLISRLALGEVELLAELYVRHDAMVKAALGRFASDISSDEREDLVQDVFLAVYDSAHRYPGEVAFRAWLYGIAVKKARSWRRNTWVRLKLLRQNRGMGVGMAFRTNSSPARRVELREMIVRAVSSLQRDQREVMLLQAAEGFKGEEIAYILGINHETVRIRLHRARKKLRKSICSEHLLAALREDEP
ncbi:MAG: RNA polymerase sigma factor [Deltaproteobacteria bacterium]|nr:RNA polymerase sigma factor [Deltaproteobacteria bacterium]